MNLRGRYEAGGWTVTCKHWWSPKSRKSARMAALICEREGEKIRAKVVAHLNHALIYGECLPFRLTDDD